MNKETVRRWLQYIVYGIVIALNTLGEFVLQCLIFLGSLVKKIFSYPIRFMRALGRRLHGDARTAGTRMSHKKHRKKNVLVYPYKIRFLTKTKYFLVGFFFACLFIFIPLVILLFIQDLPDPQELSLRQIPQTTKIYDRNNTLLYQIYATQNRTLVHLSEIPLYMQEATIAIEDKNFYTHPGFDITAIIRAFHQDTSGGSFQGGSTITQQLIKSSLLTPEPNIMRKVKELVLAFWAERIYTKKQILEMYFNQVPYGGTAWGIEAASEVYFNKNVKELDLAEASFLAGLTSAPTSYSPYGNHPDLWKQRQADVLRHMVELHYVSQKQADDAKAETLTFNPQQTPMLAPHFVNYIEELLASKYGLPMVEKGGLIVHTSLDLTLQDKVQAIVADEVAKASYLNLSNGAALVTNPKNGDILAMIGSKDFNDPDFGKVNVTTALRQPGSSIKVVTYAAALSRGFTAATILDDSPVTYSTPDGTPYSPVNYDGRFHGHVPLRIALANSLNIPAVKTLNQIGIPTMVNTAKQMGIKSWGESGNYGLSITLGGADVTMLDMATVYGTLANNGRHVSLNPIDEITDYKGAVIEKKQDDLGDQVIDPGVTYILADILSDNNARSMEFGPNSPLNIPGHTVSVKTGTTDNKRDNWTIGYTPDVVVTTWVGNDDNSPMSQNLASGITGAAPIWNRIMTMLVTEKPESKRVVPPTIVQKPCLGRMEYFIRGTENSVNCGFIPLSGTPQPTH